MRFLKVSYITVFIFAFLTVCCRVKHEKYITKLAKNINVEETTKVTNSHNSLKLKHLQLCTTAKLNFFHFFSTIF